MQREASSKTLYVCYRCGTEHTEEEREKRFCKKCKASLGFSKKKKVVEFREVRAFSPEEQKHLVTAQKQKMGEEDKEKHDLVVEWISNLRRETGNEVPAEKVAAVGALVASRLVQDFDDTNAVKQSELLLRFYYGKEVSFTGQGEEETVSSNHVVDTLKKQVMDYSHQIERIVSFAISKFGTNEELESQIDSLPWMGGEATKLAAKWIMNIATVSDSSL
jgi:DNA-directed RNA polymerase subunit RPC12/RpoP